MLRSGQASVLRTSGAGVVVLMPNSRVGLFIFSNFALRMLGMMTDSLPTRKPDAKWHSGSVERLVGAGGRQDKVCPIDKEKALTKLL